MSRSCHHIPPIFRLYCQPLTLQGSVLIWSQCHRFHGKFAFLIEIVPLPAARLQSLYHGAICTEIVPVSLIHIPSVIYHQTSAIKPVPVSVSVLIPGVAYWNACVTEVILPAAVLLIPAGFLRRFRLRRCIVLYIPPDAYKPLPPASRRP